MANMRAKVQVAGSHDQMFGPQGSKSAEVLTFHAVAANSYPEDGSDEDNTFAKFSPSAEFRITVANPALWGKFQVGEKYYVDFTQAS